jgi:hypothetical protein
MHVEPQEVISAKNVDEKKIGDILKLDFGGKMFLVHLIPARWQHGTVFKNAS